MTRSHSQCFARAGLLTGMIAVLTNWIGVAHAASDPRNFEGTWRDAPTNSPFLLGIDLPYKPEAQNIAADRISLFRQGRTVANAHLMCRPTGVQGFTSPKGPVLVFQTADRLVFISQEDREVRRIYLNRKEHPKNLKPSYSGHSIAHWEGNTLVVDTIGFNGRGQLDEAGNPHSDQLHLVERYTKSADGKTLTIELTVTDPVYYNKSWTKTRSWHTSPGVKLLDYDCAENPRSDLFDMMTYENDWYRPVCARTVTKGLASEKVICRTPGEGKK